MLPNQEVGKLSSNVTDTQANMMPNTGSPVDVEDPAQPAKPVDDGEGQVAYVYEVANNSIGWFPTVSHNS